MAAVLEWVKLSIMDGGYNRDKKNKPFSKIRTKSYQK